MIHEFVGVVRCGDDQRGGAVQIIAVDLGEEVGGAVDIAARGEVLVEKGNVAKWKSERVEALAASGEEKLGLERERRERDGKDLDGEGEVVVAEESGVEKRGETDDFVEFVALAGAMEGSGDALMEYLSK